MKKCIKWSVRILGLLVVLLGVGLVILRLMFPPEKVKQIVLDYAQNTLHREVSFDSVSFNLIGVTLNQFALSEDSSFAQGTFVKADRLSVKAALGPLFKKRIEIASVYLDGLDINIQKNKDGSFNFDSLLPADSASAANEKPQEDVGTAFAFTARRIKATDCNFSYKDLQTGFSTGVEKLNVLVNNATLDDPFPVTISFTSQTQDGNGPVVSVPVDIALNVFLAGLDLPKAYVEVSSARASYKHTQLTLQGKAENFKNPHVDLTGSISGIDNTALTDFLPDLPPFTLATIRLAAKADADLETSSLVLHNASLQMLDSSLSAQGNVNWGGTAATYQLTGKLQAHIDQLVKMTEDTGFSPQGILNGSFTATDKKDGKDVRGQLVLKNVSALYPPFTLSQTNGTIQIASLDDISCASLTGLFNGEKFTSSFAYKNIKEVLDLTLRLHLDKLILAAFPSFDTPAENKTDASVTAGANAPTDKQGPQTYFNVRADITSGEVRVPYFRTDGISVQAALTNLSENMQKANGTVSFALQPGAITDMDTLLKQSKMVRILLLPLGLLNKVSEKLHLTLFSSSDQAGKGEISLTKAEGKYTFTNGLMTIDSTTFESTVTNVNAGGTVNFTDNTLNMKASATLLTKQTPVVLKITGTLDNPSGKLDVVNTVGSVVGGVLNYKTAQSAVTGTAKTAADVATGAAKGAGTAAQETAKAAKETVKALGGLFKKKSSQE